MKYTQIKSLIMNMEKNVNYLWVQHFTALLSFLNFRHSLNIFHLTDHK